MFTKNMIWGAWVHDWLSKNTIFETQAKELPTNKVSFWQQRLLMEMFAYLLYTKGTHYIPL